MLEVQQGKGDTEYLSSNDLSRDIMDFNQRVEKLIPYLQKAASDSFYQINSEQSGNGWVQDIIRICSPTLINVRMGKEEELQRQIIQNLCDSHDFINLDLYELKTGEMERKTDIGVSLMKFTNEEDQNNQVLNIFRQVIFNGQKSCNKFILSNIPDDPNWF